jgi:hypothetical protein
VVYWFEELAHGFAGDVLSEAMAYDDHAVRLSIEADDVRLAIRAKSAFFPRTAKPRVFLETVRLLDHAYVTPSVLST